MMLVNIDCPVLESKASALPSGLAVHLDGGFANSPPSKGHLACYHLSCQEYGNPIACSILPPYGQGPALTGRLQRGHPLLPHGTKCHFCSWPQPSRRLHRAPRAKSLSHMVVVWQLRDSGPQLQPRLFIMPCLSQPKSWASHPFLRTFHAYPHEIIYRATNSTS